MLVHVAEDGRSYDLPCSQETTVDTLLASLHALTGISPENQLLICGDVRLEAGRPLRFYQLPDNPSKPQECLSSSSPGKHGLTGRHLFLFNRSRLLPRSSPPEVEALTDVTVPEATSQVDFSPHPFDSSSNPLMRTLPSYERQFRKDLLQAQAILHSSQQRFDACLRLAQEQHTQAQALRTACANMDVTGQHTLRSIDEFERSYAQQRARHAEILASFHEDLQLLGSCTLPDSLKAATGRQTLLDFVRLGRLREAYAECHAAHSQMESRVAELRGQFDDVKGGLSTMLRGPLLTWHMSGEEGGNEGLMREGGNIEIEEFLRKLDHQVQEGHRGIEEEETGVAILSEDLATVKKLLHDCLASFSPSASPMPSPSSSPSSSLTSRRSSSSQQQQSMQPLDAVAALDPMCNLHTNQLVPRVAACDRQLAALLLQVHSAKVQMTSAVHGHLQLVAKLQSRVRDIRNQLHAFREAMAHQESAFVEVAAARGVRGTYAACLGEVVRRQAFKLAYTAKAQELAEAMGKMREEEVERRHEFARQQMLLHSQFGASAAIPVEALSAMGLNELPPPCDISIPSFDTTLIQVTPADLPSGRKGGPRGAEFVRSSSTDSEASIPSMETILAEYLGPRTSRAAQSSIDTEAEDESLNAADPIQRLRLENTRLHAELAVACAGGCSGSTGSNSGWPDALQKKEAELQQLAALAEERQRVIGSYEQRVRDMEAMLAEQTKVCEGALMKVSQEEMIEKSSKQGNDMAGGSATRGHRSMFGLSSSDLKEEGSGQTTPELEEMTTKVGTASCGSGSVTMGTAGEGEAEVVNSELVGDLERLQPREADKVNNSSSLEAMCDSTLALEAGSGEQQVSRAGDPVALALCTACQGAQKAAGNRGKDGEDMRLETRGALQLVEAGALHERTQILEEEVASRCPALEELRVQLEEAKEALQQKDSVLAECQLNCAHVENKLHEAREEARNNKIAADRRASEYAVLRSAAVHTRSLLERLARCLVEPTPGARGRGQGPNTRDVLQALKAFAASLALQSAGATGQSQAGDGEEWVRSAVRVIVDTCVQLMDRAAAHEVQKDELTLRLKQTAEALVKVCDKHETAKNSAQQKIAFAEFQVQDLAVFVRNAAGHYQAVAAPHAPGCPLFLSANSLALLRSRGEQKLSDSTVLAAPDNGLSEPHFVVGRVVHMEKCIAAGLSEANESEGACGYGLQPGTPFTAMSIALLAEGPPSA